VRDLLHSNADTFANIQVGEVGLTRFAMDFVACKSVIFSRNLVDFLWQSCEILVGILVSVGCKSSLEFCWIFCGSQGMSWISNLDFAILCVVVGLDLVGKNSPVG
jgi:hypothetical protein